MIGILLINLGTPEALTRTAVSDFLREFLMDPYVITLPYFLRKLLVEFIVKKRIDTSLAAYQKIWTEQGSPLLVNSQKLQLALQKKLGENYCVQLGMRYGTPNIETALKNVAHCEKIIVLPLFPQYARATTFSALENFRSIYQLSTSTHRSLARRASAALPKIQTIDHFYDQDFYTHAYAKNINATLAKNNAEFLLLSFHSLPKKNSDAVEYERQCHVTAEKITRLVRGPNFAVTFQSRLGFTKWLTPYTDETLIELRKKNIERLCIACPSFVTDCIETLEEINLRLREQWIALGGKTFDVVPCLNDDAHWVESFATYFMKSTLLARGVS